MGQIVNLRPIVNRPSLCAPPALQRQLPYHPIRAPNCMLRARLACAPVMVPNSALLAVVLGAGKTGWFRKNWWPFSKPCGVGDAPEPSENEGTRVGSALE